MSTTAKPDVALVFESISLHVADVDRSVAFYSKLPGAELLIHREGQFAKIKFGGGHIQVVSVPAESKASHIELNARDLNALYDELKAAGLEPNHPPEKQFFGRTQFRIDDPDGNIIEFDTP